MILLGQLLLAATRDIRHVYLWRRLQKKGVVTVGKFSYGTPKVYLWDFDTKLKIGKFCSIAEEVTFILGGNHRVDWISTFPFSKTSNLWSLPPMSGHPSTKGDVSVGNDVWIGYGATILSGVTIGDGAVIGACSVVSKDVPPYAIAVGNPVKIIKYRFSKRVIRKLLKDPWWNWDERKIKDVYSLFHTDDVELFLNVTQ